ncbi:hypothetical protein, partial [Microbacterium sp. C7(2022)]|uniref:hypothetical protein n=1 Tax=Microbacterium sp. C7(2022) TaxID=2992759 RepID=UPI00237A4D6D
MTRPISRSRFDIIAGYARTPAVYRIAKEVAWFESGSAEVVGTVIIDIDGEYSGVVLASDLAGRYRWVHQTSFVPSQLQAERLLVASIADASQDFDRVRVQGDEAAPVDFFTPATKSSTLHPTFKMLSDDESFVAARRVIELMMRWYRDQDGNFVEQFQSAGFDARIWELYLFATLIEAGFAIEQPRPAPDFKAIGLDGSFCVEATTLNPSQDGTAAPRPSIDSSAHDIDAYLQHYLPIRFAGPLLSKLAKRYWEHPDVDGVPLAFAVQDFHDALSMTYSVTPLSVYLYGLVFDETRDGLGRLHQTVTPISHHAWGTKKVESGFFNLPDAEHVSAVIFNGAGTIAKFNRMGVATGFGSDKVDLVHTGVRLVGEPPAPTEFSARVTSGYVEAWIDGLNVFHNPRAVNPLDVPGHEVGGVSGLVKGENL